MSEMKDYLKKTLSKVVGNAKDIGKAAVRTGATVLTAAMLAGGLTGCNVIEQIIPGIGGELPDVDTTFPTPELKDYDEIIEDGITTKDVMDKLDVVATKIMHNAYKNIQAVLPSAIYCRNVKKRHHTVYFNRFSLRLQYIFLKKSVTGRNKILLMRPSVKSESRSLRKNF